MVNGHGLRWQGGGRDTTFGRKEIFITYEMFQSRESGVALRFPPQPKTRLSIQRLQHY